MEEEKLTQLYRDYQNGLSYANSIGLHEQIDTNIRFYEGKQWAEATENTRTMPRPVTNYVKMIVRNKKAGILSNRVKLSFSCDSKPDYAAKLTHFNDTIEKEMEIDQKREDMVEQAMVRKSAFLHYFWDGTATGEAGQYEGGVRCELIDVRNIFFANPCEVDEQKQKWILIVSRVDVDAVKAMAGKGVNTDEIVCDNAEAMGDDYKEQEGSELVTLFTRYFRKDGEVYYERATKRVMLHKPIALTPEYVAGEEDNESLTADDMDAAESNSHDEIELVNETSYKAKLYPILAYRYDSADRCIYGLSEVENLIPNQKIINLMDAMQTLSVQNNAWGKWLVAEGALRGQKITNVPGQVLVDYSPGGEAGRGIKSVQGQPISASAITLSDLLAQKTRVTSGASETVTGEIMGKNQSGDAIAQLQAQALKPIDDLKETFWRVCERGGKIVEQFYKLYYDDKQFSYMEKNVPVSDVFNGKELQGYEFTVKVEAGAGSKWSEAILAQTLEKLLSSQLIDFSTYIDLYPESAMPFKATLKQRIAEREKSENIRLKAMVEQLSAEVQKNTELIKQASSIVSHVDKLTKENEALKIEGTAKILQARKVFEDMVKKGQEIEGDARQLAQYVSNTAPIERTVIPTEQGENPNNKES